MLTLTPRFTGSYPDDLPPSLCSLASDMPTLARLYAARGIDDVNKLDYSLVNMLPAQGLRDIDKACQLLEQAIEQGSRILIVGDFDCDGATSTALMMQVLTKMGAKADFVVPDRFKYGYGLTPEIVQLAIDDYQPDVIVTVDNGISSHEGVDKAKAAGITVIITDHHLTTKATPKADAVVNPNQLGCDFVSKSLVGVGVAFYLLGRLAKNRREAGKPSVQVSQYLDLVALGTVADVGILDHNNRILVHHGLHNIRLGRCSLGILALLEQAGRDPKKISAQDFGFVLGPRINAAGRMDNMRIGIECLLSDNWQQACQLAQQLDGLNRERRRVETDMREQAEAIVQQLAEQQLTEQQLAEQQLASQVSDDTDVDDVCLSKSIQRSVILYQDDWHQGVIGIVAGRLKERYYCPAIVFAPADTDKTAASDAIKGSARSIAGIHIRDAIEQVAERYPHLISHFGGHAMAAGLTIERQHFKAFSQAFNEVMAEVPAHVFAEKKYTDGQLQPQEFSLAFADVLKNANIWGHGFEPPMFDGIFEVLNFRILKDKHLKLSLRYPNVQYPIDAIWFNYNQEVWDYTAQQIHLLFELDINEWNGNQSIQLIVRDLAVLAA